MQQPGTTAVLGSWALYVILQGPWTNAETLEGADKESWDSCQQILEDLGISAEDADKHLRKVQGLDYCALAAALQALLNLATLNLPMF